MTHKYVFHLHEVMREIQKWINEKKEQKIIKNLQNEIQAIMWREEKKTLRPEQKMRKI